MHNEEKQRFLDLDVVEVSLVDNPANEMEILVMKRQTETDKQEEDIMNTETTNNIEIQKNDEVAEAVSTGQETITKALSNVASIVENVTKAACNNTDTNQVTPVLEVAEKQAKETTTITTTGGYVELDKSSEPLIEKINEVSKSIEGIYAILNKNKEDVETQKSITIDELKKSFEAFTAAIQKSVDNQNELSERVKVIEDSRTPSQAIDGDTAVIKNTENIWKGIF